MIIVGDETINGAVEISHQWNDDYLGQCKS